MGLLAVPLRKLLGSGAETRELSRSPRSLQGYAGLNIDRDQATPHSEQNQVRVALEIESLHDVVLVELHSLLA